jgi:hypothetical protein
VKKDQIAERGARLPRRDDREYSTYLREEQHRQTGCPAREVVLLHRGQATRAWIRRHLTQPTTTATPHTEEPESTKTNGGPVALRDARA